MKNKDVDELEFEIGEQANPKSTDGRGRKLRGSSDIQGAVWGTHGACAWVCNQPDGTYGYLAASIPPQVQRKAYDQQIQTQGAGRGVLTAQ